MEENIKEINEETTEEVVEETAEEITEEAADDAMAEDGAITDEPVVDEDGEFAEAAEVFEAPKPKKNKAIIAIIVVLILTILLSAAAHILQYREAKKLEERTEDMEVIIQYGLLGGMEISDFADDMRKQIEAYEKENAQ